MSIYSLFVIVAGVALFGIGCYGLIGQIRVSRRQQHAERRAIERERIAEWERMRQRLKEERDWRRSWSGNTDY